LASADWVRDQLEIRQTIERYFDAACRRRSDEIMQLWADDCRWSVPEFPGLENVTGKAAIRERFEAAQKMLPVAFVIGMVGDIQIDGDHAMARVYTTEVLEDTAGKVSNGVGRYEDTLQRIDGQWLFRERIWHCMYRQ
jgi:ketosteroid isomerase-like protein